MKLTSIKILGSVFFVILLCCSYKCSTKKEIILPKNSILEQDGPYVFFERGKYHSITGTIKDNNFKSSKKKIDTSTPLNVGIPTKGLSFDVNILKEHTVDTSHFELPQRVFTISDVEGDFDFFVGLLIANKVIDNNFNWSFGDGHLVVLGDTFDRGSQVTELLWLIYKLEQEANSAGGKIHFIIGNHEAMAITGDDRYIHKKYRTVCSSLKMPYSELYAGNTVLGDWLRSKNSIITLGRLLFVHGGISPVMMMSEIKPQLANEMIRAALTDYYDRKLTKEEKFLLGASGPLWYRDMVLKRIRNKDLINVMYYMQADHVIMGHTLVENIATAFEGKVIAVDVDRRKTGKLQGLLIENGEFFIADGKGVKVSL